ncbi:MAG: hypothetical protein LBT87_11015 [Treponema sp.]|jgi:hypothetical protein|nr:hypothetical protein [Treponema sp.]
MSRQTLDSAPDIHTGFPKESAGSRPAALLSLLSRLKLPVDGLSVSIVSFAKFFSLPLNPALLAKIRRQAVSGPSGPGTSLSGGRTAGNTDPAIREARSLACIAALDKGVELNPESLERYARVIAGWRFSPEAPGADERSGGEARGNAENRPKPGDDRFPANPETGQGSGGEGEEGPEGGGNRGGDPETLRNLAREAEAREPLIGLLNRLPGKDGKRWLVIPIPLEDAGVRLYATLRLLLSPRAGLPAGSSGDVEQMSLEINGGRRRWLFRYRPGSILRAALWPETEEGERAGLEQELAGSLGLPPGQIKITGWDPVFAPDCRNNDLFSVREEV